MNRRFARPLALVATLTLTLLLSASPAAALDRAEFGQIGPVTFWDRYTLVSTSFFPIGWYNLGTLDDLAIMDELVAAGANALLFTDLGENAASEDGAYQQKARRGLDLAHARGIKVTIGLSRELFKPLICWDVFGVRKCSGEDRLASWVAALVNHPAILGWQLGDEEGQRESPTVQQIVDGARLVRSWDPDRDIWQVNAGDNDDVTTEQLWVGTDVYSADRYSYWYGNGTDAAHQNLMAHYTTGAIRSSDNGWLGNLNVAQGGGDFAGGGVTHRFPTADEYRWSVFAALAGAASRGTMNWALLHSTPSFRSSVVRPVFHELRRLSRAMTNGWNVGTVSASPSDLLSRSGGPTYRRISTLLVHDAVTHTYFLIVTNNGATTQDVTVSLQNLPIVPRARTVWTSGSSTIRPLVDVAPGRWALSEQLPGYAVRVYELPDASVGIINGMIAGTGSWTSTGNAQFLSTGRTADGSGSLKLWASSWGNTGSSWRQTFSVEPNALQVVRWFVRPGSIESYYGYDLRTSGGVLLASALDTRAAGGWQVVEIPFNPGDENRVTLTLHSYSTDWVQFDDLLHVTSGLPNADIATGAGWRGSGTAAYVGEMGRTVDATGSLKLWASSFGAASGTWTSCSAVTPNVEHVWRWHARAAGAESYYSWRVSDSEGTVLATNGPLHAYATWGAAEARFNPGTRRIACVELVSFGVDWTLFDEMVLAPARVTNGEARTTAGWTASGHVYYDPSASAAADGSGSLKLFAPGWGVATSRWSQWVTVTPNASHTLRFWGRSGASEGYFGYEVRTADGATLFSTRDTRAVNGWQPYVISFQPGASQLVQVVFSSYSVDWVEVDGVSVTRD